MNKKKRLPCSSKKCLKLREIIQKWFLKLTHCITTFRASLLLFFISAQHFLQVPIYSSKAPLEKMFLWIKARELHMRSNIRLKGYYNLQMFKLDYICHNAVSKYTYNFFTLQSSGIRINTSDFLEKNLEGRKKPFILTYL